MGHLFCRLGLLAALLAALPHGAFAAVEFKGGALAAWLHGNDTLIAIGTTAPTLQNLGSCSAETLQQNTLHGVVVRSCGAWGIEKRGTTWVLTPQGKASMPKASLLKLRDGWRLGGTMLKKAEIEANGVRWQVGLTNTALRQTTTLAGAMQRLGKVATPTAAVPDKVAFYVSIEPAAGLSPTTTPAVDEQALAKDLALPVAAIRRLQSQPTQLYTPGQRVPLPKVAIVVPPVTPIEVSASQPLAIEQADVPTPTTPVSGTTAASAAATTPEPAEESHGEKPSEAGHGEAAAEGAHGQVATEASTPPPAVVREVVDAKPNETRMRGPLGVIIPPRGENGYVADMAEALQAVADAPVGSAAGREARLALASVYLSWQRPEEALAVLATVPQRADGEPAAALPRLLSIVARVAQSKAVPEAAFDLEGDLAPHAKLWQAVGQAQQGNYSLAIQNWPKERGILPDYPDYLREIAQYQQVAALVFTGQQQAAIKVIKQLAESYGAAGLPPRLKRLHGLAMMGTPDEQQGLELLAEAAENTTDLGTALRAKFEFVRALHQRRDISDAQLRQYLNDLQQDWRGDETEREILSLLADLYEKDNNPQMALQTWQTLVQAFPRTPAMATNTASMAQAFVNVFDPEREKPFDDLTYMGLYYDFRELMPNDPRGDRVQELMAEEMIKANLFERAAPILEQQLQFRPLDEVAQGRLSLLLAETYVKQGKPEEALKLLDTRRALANTQTLRRGWALTEARALAQLSRPQAAGEVLKPLLAPDMPTDKEAATLAAQVAWQGQDWPNAARGFSALLEEVPASSLVSDTAAQLNLFQLAYALSQVPGNHEQLAQLKARYAAAWPQLPRLADDVNAVAATSGVQGVSPEGGPLQALTTAMSEINTLDDKIAATRRQLQRSRAAREEYNRRMEYMELLPPPAL